MAEEKRRKPQGKLNYKTILKGLLAGMKKQDIAPIAGSLAESPVARINAIRQAVNTTKFKKMSEGLIDKLDKEVERLIDSMTNDDLLSVEYKDKSASVERLKKLSELLKGGKTENIGVSSEELKTFLDRA